MSSFIKPIRIIARTVFVPKLFIARILSIIVAPSNALKISSIIEKKIIAVRICSIMPIYIFEITELIA
ncbi:MAG: hypothetical protein ACK53L_24975, partial [Pirellulaceae bacterium]